MSKENELSWVKYFDMSLEKQTHSIEDSKELESDFNVQYGAKRNSELEKKLGNISSCLQTDHNTAALRADAPSFLCKEYDQNRSRFSFVESDDSGRLSNQYKFCEYEEMNSLRLIKSTDLCSLITNIAIFFLVRSIAIN